ncbi:platelet-derived growth factor receptor-like protein isoform X2 [Genypterus blacodes]|uniref:platelet-derived growth factor receptor-like protein isoform X2 n=1 Tax=Genypterus blacodes TaxID=154954 RepID=UPI003F75F8B6
MKLWLVLCLALLWVELQNGDCQQVKRRKDTGENRIKPGGKRVKGRIPKLKDGGGRGQSLLTQVLEKGNFLRLGPSTTLPPGRNMELRCKGTNMGWSYPSYLDTFNDSRLSIVQSDRYSQLILTSPSAADTGHYSCWVIVCDGTECEKDAERIYASYLYFTDRDNLFVPSATHFEIVYLRPDRAAVLPCRVTNPQARVTLHREVPAEEILSNGTLLTYDPTKGFILRSPTVDHQGVFYCKAVTKGTPQVSNKYLLLFVEVPSGAPSVSLEGSMETVEEGGDRLNITCTALGEPEEEVSFSWTYPGQARRPVHIQTSMRLVDRGTGRTTRMSQSFLIIDDVERSDTGLYVCTAKNKHGQTVVSTRL